jgi:D-glycero-alpha-D-manno-heptose 1-phosphate guanylyltransferase
MEAIILVGGRGERLQAVLPDSPKPIAPIAGVPFLIFLLRWLEASKLFTKVVLAVGYQQEKIRQTIAAAGEFAFKIEFSQEASALGTGGAARQALEFVDGDRFMLLNGDSFVDVDLLAFTQFHNKKAADLTMVVKREANTSRFGSVAVRDLRIVDFLEKAASTGAGLINAGVYVVERGLMAQFSLGEAFSLEAALPELLDNNCYAFECNNKFIDIGLPETYEVAGAYLLECMERYIKV